MNEQLRTSAEGQRLIKHYEQCRLTAYPDPGSGGAPWTIGFGDTAGVTRGMTITQAEADARFALRLARDFEPVVRRAVRVPLNQGQFDALVSAVYNLGPGVLTGTTLIGKLNAGDYAGAAAELPRWCRANGQVLRGLQRRREAEKRVFSGQGVDAAILAAERMYP